MPGPENLQYRASARNEIFYDTTNLAAGASTTGATYVDIRNAEHLHIFTASTGGTYQLQFLWSRDGTTTLYTETITVVNGGRSAVVQCITPYVKVKVNNTHGTDAFTAHVTTVLKDGQ